MEQYVPIALSVVSLLGTLIAVIVNTRTRRTQNKKTEAETGATDAKTLNLITETALSLIQPLKDQLEQMDFDLAFTQSELKRAVDAVRDEEQKRVELESELAVLNGTHILTLKRLKSVEARLDRASMRSRELTYGVTLLVNQLMTLGVPPVWTLKEIEELTKDDEV